MDGSPTARALTGSTTVNLGASIANGSFIKEDCSLQTESGSPWQYPNQTSTSNTTTLHGQDLDLTAETHDSLIVVPFTQSCQTISITQQNLKHHSCPRQLIEFLLYSDYFRLYRARDER